MNAQMNPTTRTPKYTLGTPVIPIDNGDRQKFLYVPGLPKQFVLVENTLLPVGVLKFDEAYDLLAISQHSDLSAAGHIDMTDEIDPEVSVDALYFLDAENQTWSIIDTTLFSDAFCFERNVEYNWRVKLLMEHITIPMTLEGTAYRVKFSVSGELNYEFGNVKVWTGAPEVVNCSADDADRLNKLARQYNPLRGYKIGAYRANSNRAPR